MRSFVVIELTLNYQPEPEPQTGLCRSEVVKLDINDINIDSGEIAVRQGKGGKDTITFLQSGAEQYIQDWLALRGDADGALFNPVSQKGEINIGYAMTDQTVMNMLLKRNSRTVRQTRRYSEKEASGTTLHPLFW